MSFAYKLLLLDEGVLISVGTLMPSFNLSSFLFSVFENFYVEFGLSGLSGRLYKGDMTTGSQYSFMIDLSGDEQLWAEFVEEGLILVKAENFWTINLLTWADS